MRSACNQHAISRPSLVFWDQRLDLQSGANQSPIRVQSVFSEHLLINGHQWSSESNQSSQNTCSSVVISGHQWSSAISLLRTPAPNDASSPPPSVVISGHYWSLEALTCSQRRSLSASSAASRSRRTSDSINERIASESRAYAADSCAVVPTRVVVRVAPPSLFGLPPSAAAAAAASSAPASGAAASSSSTVVGGGLMHASRLSRLGSSRRNQLSRSKSTGAAPLPEIASSRWHEMISRNRNQELSAAIRSHQWHSPAGVRILEREMQPPPQKDLGELELSLGQEL